MNAFVLDCSIAIAWCFADEATPQTNDLLSQCAVEGALVPGLWHLEVANVLVNASRRSRISADDVLSRTALLGQLPIRTEPDALIFIPETIELACTSGLSAYDAAYLELAQRRALPLATLDKQLRRVAEQCDVPILPQ